MTVGEWLESAHGRLSAAGFAASKLEAQMLAAHVMGVDRSWLYAHPEADFPKLAGETLLQRRENHEPLAYIVGWREFYGRRFSVNPNVLVPRQETETLVEAALKYGKEGASVLDVGTGSGVIAVTLKLERPDWTVTALDVSEPALEVAEDNARALGAEVRLVRSDLFEELLGESFDLIVTNPPYIGRGEELEVEVAEHEPSVALFGGDKGDEVLQRIAAVGSDYLVTGGMLLTEVGYQQAESVQRLFEAEGWRHVETVQDLYGVNRVLVFQAVFECAL